MLYALKQYYSKGRWTYENILSLSFSKPLLEEFLKTNYDLCFKIKDKEITEKVECIITPILKVKQLDVMNNSKQEPILRDIFPPNENKYFVLSTSYDSSLLITDFMFVDFPAECPSREYEDYIEYLKDDIGYNKVNITYHIKLDKFYDKGLHFAYNDEHKIYSPPTQLFGLYGGDKDQQILFAISQHSENLKLMMKNNKLNLKDFTIENIGLWVLSTPTKPLPYHKSDFWMVYWKEIEPWRLGDKLFCYTRLIKNQLKDVILRVGHHRPENSWKYINYIKEVRKVFDLSERVEFDKYYEDGMMN